MKNIKSFKVESPQTGEMPAGRKYPREILLSKFGWLFIILLIFSCSDDIGPCYPMEQQCKNLLNKMEKATDPKEKEQLRQFYLSEKHLLENCYRENGK